MSMEKRGVLDSENVEPPEEVKKAEAPAAPCGCPYHHQSTCGDDSLSKMADAVKEESAPSK
jgi:hypothetical protein